ncbi:hydrolase-like protein [Rhypophila sp. PSN 637]
MDSISDSPERYSFPSSPVADAKAVVGGADGDKFRFTVLTERLVRYEWSDDGTFEDRASTLAVFRKFEPPKFEVEDAKGKVTITTKSFSLTYRKAGSFDDGGLSVAVGGETWKYDGESYGDLGGTSRTLDNADGRIPLEPGVLSRKPYSVLDDSKSMLFDHKGWIGTRVDGRKDGYVFAHNGHYKSAIKDFYGLSGRQPLLPRWALGNWWSRYHEYTAHEYKQLVRDFEHEEIPLTVAVLDMDWHKVKIPAKYGSGWTGYSWNRDLFPNPPKFLEWLRWKGLKVTVNDHPADGIRAFEDLYQEVANALGHDTSKEAPIQFDCTDRKFMDAYFDVLKKRLEDEGIDFWWMDWQQGDKTKLPGVDPLWVLNHYHYLTSKRNISRLDKPLTFSRYAGPGSHRYPIGFSGDTYITWESLNFQPEFTATASNIGYGWWSHDIGGHMFGIRSNEMMVRWVQLGCFSPILRLHATKDMWLSKEPWMYEDQAHKAIKDFLVFRHKLIPYLFTMSVRASYDNEPLIQPMYWSHGDQEDSYSVPNQYYFGPQLIVAPITSPNDKATFSGSVKAWLPPSNTNRRYIDLFKPTMVYDSGRYITLHRSLDQIPVLAPEGTIIALEVPEWLYECAVTHPPRLRHGAAKRPDIHIKLVVGADASFELVEEPVAQHDADDIHPPRNSFVSTLIKWSQKEGKLTIAPGRNDMNKERLWLVEVVGVTDPRAAGPLFNAPVWREARLGKVGLELLSEKARRENSTFRILHQSPRNLEVNIGLGEDLQLDVVNIRDRVEEVLYRCEMEYRPKNTIWSLVTGDGGDGDVSERVEKLKKLGGVPRSVKELILEIWGADGRSEGTAAGLLLDVDQVQEDEDEEYDDLALEGLTVRSVDGDTVLVHRK